MSCRSQGDEELTPIRLGSAVRHANHSLAIMFQLRTKLILELLSPDTLAARAIFVGVITTLDHKTLDDAVEWNVVVFSLRCQAGKILDRLNAGKSLERGRDLRDKHTLGVSSG